MPVLTAYQDNTYQGNIIDASAQRQVTGYQQINLNIYFRKERGVGQYLI